MQLDIGEVRFLTKVAQKSPRGLRLLLFKEKSSGKEKLVFIVKTASEDIDKLALSKMTWQVEQSKNAARVVVVRLLILPEGSNEFFQSEAGLLMNEEKDRNSLGALARQKSVEIFFFTYESEFHSKIELMTTYNMGKTAQALMELNPLIDEGKLIVKSESLSENDIKNAMTGKVKDVKLKDKDLMDSIQAKMPVISSSLPKTKPEEISKTSIKSNDMAVSGSYGAPPVKKPAAKKTELSTEDLKKVSAKPAGKITPEDLLKSLPPNKIVVEEILAGALDKPAVESKSSLKPEDLLKVVNDSSVPTGSISPEELLGSIPPNTLTSEELLKSLGGNAGKDDTIPAEAGLKANDLLESLNYAQATATPEPGLSAQDLLKSITSPGLKSAGLNESNLFDTLQSDENNFFMDNQPTVSISVGAPTQELKRDDLLDALKSEPSPLKAPDEEEKKKTEENKPEPPIFEEEFPVNENEITRDLKNDIKISTTSPMSDDDKKEEDSAISEDDLLKILNGEL
jgi:hypothetical protein